MSTLGAPGGRVDHIAVWNGNEMIVALGTDYPGCRSISDACLSGRCPSSASTAVWSGTELMVSGGECRYCQPARSDFGGDIAYNPISNTWRSLGSGSDSVPTGRSHAGCVWTGTELLVWGGLGWSGV